MPPLSDTPQHRALEWFVDVIAHRKGEVTHEELVEHCTKDLTGPVSTLGKSLRRWATDIDGAVLESLEVDDPTYMRGYLARGERRWFFIVEVEDGKVSLLKIEHAR